MQSMEIIQYQLQELNKIHILQDEMHSLDEFIKSLNKGDDGIDNMDVDDGDRPYDDVEDDNDVDGIDNMDVDDGDSEFQHDDEDDKIMNDNMDDDYGDSEFPYDDGEDDDNDQDTELFSHQHREKRR
jgi:hypothetical protein